jgi:hypothetical protein
MLRLRGARGASIVKDNGVETLASGVHMVILALPGEAMSLAEIAACKCPESIKVVALLDPFH